MDRIDGEIFRDPRVRGTRLDDGLDRDRPFRAIGMRQMNQLVKRPHRVPQRYWSRAAHQSQPQQAGAPDRRVVLTVSPTPRFAVSALCALVGLLAVGGPGETGRAEGEAGEAVLPVVTTEELQRLQHLGSGLVVVDARSPETYAHGHVPGALNVPAEQVETLGPTLPKDAAIVTYCGGPNCGASVAVGRWLAAHGWPRVWHYRAGFPAWQAAGYPVETEPPAVGLPTLPGSGGCADGTC